MTNPFQFVFDLWEKISGLFSTLSDFLLYEFSVAGIDISVWQLLGGAGLIALIVWSIIRG